MSVVTFRAGVTHSAVGSGSLTMVPAPLAALVSTPALPIFVPGEVAAGALWAAGCGACTAVPATEFAEVAACAGESAQDQAGAAPAGIPGYSVQGGLHERTVLAGPPVCNTSGPYLRHSARKQPPSHNT